MSKEKKISRKVTIHFYDEKDFTPDNISWDKVNYEISCLCDKLEEQRKESK